MTDDNAPPLIDVSDNEDNHELEEDDKEGASCEEVDGQNNLDIDNNKGHAQHKHNVNCFVIEDGYGVKPTVRIQYNDKYTSAWAGQPLTHQESGDHVYGAALGDGDNPWAPFYSKQDWEIARWAKL